MKSFVAIFASAVLAGLGVFFLFDWLNAFALLNNTVMVNITVFVCLLTASTTAAAALSAFFHHAIGRADDKLMAKLEQRIRALEQSQSPQSTSAPAAPPAAEHAPAAATAPPVPPPV